MNPQELQNKIAEYFAKLPADAQVMFSGMEWMKTLENLSTKYNMTPNQVQTLGTETTLLLLGIVHPDEYANFLKADLSLSQDAQDKLMADINLGILNKWHDTLAQVYTQNTTDIANKEYGGEKKLDERFANLPREVKDAITNSDYQKELYLVASEQNLSIDQMDKLEKATNKILLGIEHPDKYEKMLETELGLPAEKAVELSNIVNERILKNIREILKSHGDVHAEIPVPKPLGIAPQIEIPRAPIQATPTPVTQAIVTPKPTVQPVAEASYMPTPVLNTTFIPQAALPHNDDHEKIFSDSGIEFVMDTPTTKQVNLPTTENVVAKEEKMMKDDGVSLMEEDIAVPKPPMEVNKDTAKDLLFGIENPSTIQTPIAKTTPPNPTMSSSDPYREHVE